MRKQLGVFAVIFVVLLVLFFVAEKEFSNVFNGCIAKSYSDNKNVSKENESSLGLSVFSYVICSGHYLEENGAAITALATIVIAAFTGTLWYATSQQAQMTREAFIADKRAFVFAKGFNAMYEPGPNNRWNWRFSPVWQNSGDMPTEGCSFYCDSILSNTPMVPNIDLTYENPASPRGPGMLGPKSESPAGMTPRLVQQPITPQDIADIQAGSKFFYFYGSARYGDSLPGTPRRITRFCWQMIVTGDPFAFDPAVNPNSVRWSNLHQGRGNCADNECILQGLG